MNPTVAISLTYSQWWSIINALSGDDLEVHGNQSLMAGYLKKEMAKSPRPDVEDLQAIYDEAAELMELEAL